MCGSKFVRKSVVSFAPFGIMSNPSTSEICPVCGSSDHVRLKSILIDDGWVHDPEKDNREAHFASLRSDDVKPEYKKPAPQHQFLDGFYCDSCGLGFVPDRYEADGARYYYSRIPSGGYRKGGT